MKKFSLFLFSPILSFKVLAAPAEAVPTDSGTPTIGLSASELLVLAAFLLALVALFATVVMLKALKVIVNERLHPKPFIKYEAPKPLDYETWQQQKKQKPNIWSKLLSLKPIEEEEALVIPHAYDGIHELNNPVPRWFNVLFYGTMIFAACYLYYYHISDGPGQDEEYIAEMTRAAADKKAFLATAAEKFDENSIKPDPSLIAKGKTIFMANCIACHGEHGQGIVGPNLTDEFWLHGGSINDVFKTVKYGVPAKGMASWEKTLSAKNIAEVVNFIMSLQGTRPANAKAPQGEKYEPKSAKDTLTHESITKK